MANDHEDAVLLEKVDHGKRMARFYAISVEPTLFAETALVRRWGRIGTRGRQRIELHASPVVAQRAPKMDRPKAPPRLHCERLIHLQFGDCAAKEGK